MSECKACASDWYCDDCGRLLSSSLEEIERIGLELRVERQRVDKAQAEVARRGDVMLAALREIERGEYNAAAMMLANVVRPPLPSPAQVTHYKPGPAPERRPAEVMHTTIGGRGGWAGVPVTIDDRIAALEATLAELRAQRDKPAPTLDEAKAAAEAAALPIVRALVAEHEAALAALRAVLP